MRTSKERSTLTSPKWRHNGARPRVLETPEALLLEPSLKRNDSVSNPHLTAARLRELLHYDPETGDFTWRVNCGTNRTLGKVAGTFDKKGYRLIWAQGKQHKAHRLAWLYMTGEWPQGMIDHKDGNTGRNVFDNLRDVSGGVNNQNMRKPGIRNRSGFLGVAVRPDGKFHAYIKQPEGKQVYLGSFDDPELAHAAYIKAKRAIHQGCTI